jgi:hypothetical protein
MLTANRADARHTAPGWPGPLGRLRRRARRASDPPAGPGHAYAAQERESGLNYRSARSSPYHGTWETCDPDPSILLNLPSQGKQSPNLPLNSGGQRWIEAWL